MLVKLIKQKIGARGEPIFFGVNGKTLHIFSSGCVVRYIHDNDQADEPTETPIVGMQISEANIIAIPFQDVFDILKEANAKGRIKHYKDEPPKTARQLIGEI
jgi:hypothetical protein